MGYNFLEPQHLQELGNWSTAENLQGLCVAVNQCGPRLAPLFHSGRLKNLHFLNVARCELDDSSLEEIAAAGLNQLTHLSVAHNEEGAGPSVTGAGISALFRHSSLPHLRVFSCETTGFDDQAAIVLAESPQLAQLRVLDVGQTQLTSRGLMALLRSAYLTNLRRLRIPLTKCDDACVPDLLNSPALARLEYLNIGETNFSPYEVGRLRKRFKTALVEKAFSY